MLVSQGSLTWGLRATRAASLKTAPSDRFLFLFIANSFVKKNKAFVQEYRDGCGRYCPGADGSPERLRAVSSKGPIVPHSSSEMLSQGPWGLSLPWDQTDTLF